MEACSQKKQTPDSVPVSEYVTDPQQQARSVSLTLLGNEGLACRLLKTYLIAGTNEANNLTSGTAAWQPGFSTLISMPQQMLQIWDINGSITLPDLLLYETSGR